MRTKSMELDRALESVRDLRKQIEIVKMLDLSDSIKACAIAELEQKIKICKKYIIELVNNL